LSSFAPSTISSHYLVSADDDIFSLKEAFESWIMKKISQSRFYLKLHGTLSWLFACFFIEATRFFAGQLAPKRVRETRR